MAVNERIDPVPPEAGPTEGPDGEPGPEPAPGAPTPGPSSARVPAEALSQRNEMARAKGLPGVMIQGGTDPDPDATRERERPYVRLLLIMIAVIVLGGFVLGFVGMVVGGPAPS